jgi:hypothetical protein
VHDSVYLWLEDVDPTHSLMNANKSICASFLTSERPAMPMHGIDYCRVACVDCGSISLLSEYAAVL